MGQEDVDAESIGGLVSDLGEMLSSIPDSNSRSNRIMKVLGRPLAMAGSVGKVYSEVMSGDTDVAASSAIKLGGEAAGGWAGAAAGAAIGSVVPVIGTAVGAAVGGALGAWGGGELGSLLGETIGSKLTSWFSEDKTEIPGKSPAEQIVQQTTKTETSNRFDIKFDVKASGDPEQDNALVAKIQQAMTSLIPSLMATATPLDTRMDGSLMGLGRD